MFEPSQEKITQAIVDALQPVLRTSAMFGNLPFGYWNDAFVVGFMQGVAAALALRMTKKKDIDKNHVTAMLLAYDTLSEGQGKAIGLRMRDLAKAADQDFLCGVGNAMMCVKYAYGDEDYPGDPHVAKAQRAGSDFTSVLGHADRKHPERTRTAGALLFILFHTIVRERLGT